MTNPLAALPSVDRLLQKPDAIRLIETYGRAVVTQTLRECLDDIRGQLRNGSTSDDDRDAVEQRLSTQVLTQTESAISARHRPSLQAVINLSGIVVHTNLGRAPYPAEAIEAMSRTAAGNCNLEFDLVSGKRGHRDSHVVHWICELTGAEDALVVNNNAAAVMLCLNTLALNRNVLVSRGELIEIGGSFRMPEIMRQSGTRLREVGTTNRTHLADFEKAIGKKTAAIMRVHTSNFEVVGFRADVEPTELAKLAQAKGLPFIDDLGSGNLIDLTAFGLPEERTVAKAIEDGASLVTFSGDKLLGGPQCGVIAGRKDLIARLNNNPMKRALRLDKVTLSALEAVLRMYTNPDTLAQRLPVLAMLTRSSESIKETAHQLVTAFNSAQIDNYKASVEACYSEIGSGALPTRTIDSWACVCRVVNDESKASASRGRIETLARDLRRLAVPIIGRISDGALWLDCRALLDATPVVAALSSPLNRSVSER